MHATLFGFPYLCLSLLMDSVLPTVFLCTPYFLSLVHISVSCGIGHTICLSCINHHSVYKHTFVCMPAISRSCAAEYRGSITSPAGPAMAGPARLVMTFSGSLVLFSDCRDSLRMRRLSLVSHASSPLPCACTHFS